MTLAWVICPHSVDLRSSHCLLCDGWTRSQAKAVTAERARIAAAVRGLCHSPTPEDLLAECERLGCEQPGHPTYRAEATVKLEAVLAIVNGETS